jgi:environmental stress-induced protein Ves
MSGLQVIELASVTPQTWRNGGGVTRELLTWPPGSQADWLLRVSVAEIERDGPFSPFPGVQRCFAVLEGAGVVLGLPGGERRLTRESPPLDFDGADAPACRLVEGPTRDLNLMGRASAGRIGMRPAAAGEDSPAASRWLGLYAASPAVLKQRDGSALCLAPHSLAWGECPGQAWQVAAQAGHVLRAWWLWWSSDR